MSALQVLLGQEPVGLLQRFEDEAYRFSFDEQWLHDPERSILGQIFEDRRPNKIETSGMPCWFAHLLPQGPLRRLLAREASIEEPDDFAVLTLCGEDLPGAVVLRWTDAIEPPRRRRDTVNVNRTDQRLGLGFSLAGNQWKLSVRPDERGLVVPVYGESGTFIAKFQDPGYRDLPRVEFATTMWARAAGIPVPEVQLLPLASFADLPAVIPRDEEYAFVTRRFDRMESGRVHMEDFGQILDQPPGDRQFSGRYEDIVAVLAYLAPQDVQDFVERLVFGVLCGNGDAHLKNWAVYYPDRRSARLTPAYDLVSTVLYLRNESLALSLGGTRKFGDLNEASFDGLAVACGRSVAEVRRWVKDSAQRVRERFATATELPFRKEERERLGVHLMGIRL